MVPPLGAGRSPTDEFEREQRMTQFILRPPKKTYLALQRNKSTPTGYMTHTFFPFPLPLSQRNTESGQGDDRGKPHSTAAQDLSRSGLAQPLTASECGITFAGRKRKKSFIIVMSLNLHDNDIYLFIVDAVYNSVMCGYMP